MPLPRRGPAPPEATRPRTWAGADRIWQLCRLARQRPPHLGRRPPARKGGLQRKHPETASRLRPEAGFPRKPGAFGKAARLRLKEVAGAAHCPMVWPLSVTPLREKSLRNCGENAFSLRANAGEALESTEAPGPGRLDSTIWLSPVVIDSRPREESKARPSCSGRPVPPRTKSRAFPDA